MIFSFDSSEHDELLSTSFMWHSKSSTEWGGIMNPFGSKKPKIIYAEKAKKDAFFQSGGFASVDFGIIAKAVEDMAKKCMEQDAEGSLQSLVDAVGAPPGVVQMNIQMMAPSSGFNVKYRQYGNDVLIRFTRSR